MSFVFVERNAAGGANHAAALKAISSAFEDRVCKQLYPSYFHDRAPESDWIAYASTGSDSEGRGRTRTRYKINGFAFGTYESDGVVHLQLICARKGHGTALIHELMTRMTLLHKRAIQLESVPEAMGFYRAVGFQNTRFPDQELSAVTKAADSLRVHHERPTKATLKLTTNFFDTLIKLGLAADASCQSATTCDEFGYVMVRYLGTSSDQPVTHRRSTTHTETPSAERPRSVSRRPLSSTTASRSHRTRSRSRRSRSHRAPAQSSHVSQHIEVNTTVTSTTRSGRTYSQPSETPGVEGEMLPGWEDILNDTVDFQTLNYITHWWQ